MLNGIKIIMKLSKKSYVGIIVLALVLGFIFVNSILNWNTSMLLSKLPERLAYSVVSYGDYKWLDNFVIHQIRGFAHLSEFFVLSVVITKLYYSKRINPQRLINTFFMFFLISFLDETIQMFTDRHARISDIWLDLLGATIGFLVYLLCYFIKKLIIKRKQSEQGGKAD